MPLNNKIDTFFLRLDKLVVHRPYMVIDLLYNPLFFSPPLHNISCNSPRDSKLLAGFNNNSDRLKELKLCHPVGEIGQVDDLSKLAIAIVSDGLSFLHGACIPFDGGIRSRLYDPE